MTTVYHPVQLPLFIDSKVCSKCLIEKSLHEFYKAKSGKYGRRADCKECRDKQTNAYASEHPEMNREAVRNYKITHESHKEATKEWEKAHPESRRRREHKRRAHKMQVGGSYTAAEWEALKAHYNFTCLCCGKREPEIRLTADHVIPLVKGGRNSIENLQPLCKPCNSRKNTKIIDYRPLFNREMNVPPSPRHPSRLHPHKGGPHSDVRNIRHDPNNP